MEKCFFKDKNMYTLALHIMLGVLAIYLFNRKLGGFEERTE